MFEVVDWGYSGSWGFMNIVMGLCSVMCFLTILPEFKLPRWTAFMAFIPMIAVANLVIIMSAISRRQRKEKS